MNHRNLIAILRGIRSEEAPAVGEALVASGISRIEVPLNSPDPLASITALKRSLPAGVEVGAGTVLTVAQVDAVVDAGATFMVAPNIDPEVVAHARIRELETWPGVFTPSECLVALKAGAHGLKLFPAFKMGTDGIAAIRAVLPGSARIVAVGGVDSPDFAAYAKAGCNGFGLGSNLYRPGYSAEEVASRAARMVETHDAVFGWH